MIIHIEGERVLKSFVCLAQAAVIELIVHKRRKESDRRRQQEAVRCRFLSPFLSPFIAVFIAVFYRRYISASFVERYDED